MASDFGWSRESDLFLERDPLFALILAFMKFRPSLTGVNPWLLVFPKPPLLIELLARAALIKFWSP